ncbi:MAG: hypothetical protein Q8L55_15980 [Phycisphaerales bacterium]|nr:hypothetical protein [Phycisphaerales bacterium]
MPDNDRSPSAADTTTDGEGLAQRLIEQVAALQQRIDKAERRIRIERALADAQATDIPAAADEIEQGDTGAGDLAAVVRTLKRTKPGLFVPHATAARGAAELPAADPPRTDPHLMVLREKAAKGDRASLLLYLRARRSKA